MMVVMMMMMLLLLLMIMMYICIAHAVTPCYCSMLGALGRVVSFEVCCQWALLSVQITRHYSIVFKFTGGKYIYPFVSKVHAGSFRVSVIHRNLTWTTGANKRAYVIILRRAYTHGGWAHRQRCSTTVLTRKNSHK